MRNYITVDGTDLRTFGVYCSGQGTFGAPEREFTTYNVPGRDGAVLGANTRLVNASVSYDCFICANFDANIAALRSFLLSKEGYVRIEDTYHQDEYRMGFYEGPFEPTITRKNDAGSFTLAFNCQPQRWLKSGETEIAIEETWAASQRNPSSLEAKPLIHITGLTAYTEETVAFDVYKSSGSRSNDGRCIKIFDTFPYTSLYIDCALMEVYSPGTNYAALPVSQHVAIGSFGRVNSQPVLNTPGLDPPVIPGGGALVRYGTSAAVAKMIPRWCKL